MPVCLCLCACACVSVRVVSVCQPDGADADQEKGEDGGPGLASPPPRHPLGEKLFKPSLPLFLHPLLPSSPSSPSTSPAPPRPSRPPPFVSSLTEVISLPPLVAAASPKSVRDFLSLSSLQFPSTSASLGSSLYLGAPLPSPNPFVFSCLIRFFPSPSSSTPAGETALTRPRRLVSSQRLYSDSVKRRRLPNPPKTVPTLRNIR